jgi:hypothetical protein
MNKYNYPSMIPIRLEINIGAGERTIVDSSIAGMTILLAREFVLREIYAYIKDGLHLLKPIDEIVRDGYCSNAGFIGASYDTQDDPKNISCARPDVGWAILSYDWGGWKGKRLEVTESNKAKSESNIRARKLESLQSAIDALVAGKAFNIPLNFHDYEYDVPFDERADNFLARFNQLSEMDDETFRNNFVNNFVDVKEMEVKEKVFYEKGRQVLLRSGGLATFEDLLGKRVRKYHGGEELDGLHEISHDNWYWLANTCYERNLSVEVVV